MALMSFPEIFLCNRALLIHIEIFTPKAFQKKKTNLVNYAQGRDQSCHVLPENHLNLGIRIISDGMQLR
jgi:hypothetical protein